MKKIFKKYRNIIFLVIACLLIVLTGVYGRYIYRGIKNYYLSSKGFYFNSDKLSEDGSFYQLDNWSGVDPVTVKVNMDSKRNNKLASRYNIEYSITFECSTNVTCTSDKNSGILMNGVNTDNFTITMTPNVTLSNNDSVWLRLKTKATDPYEKELTGEFVINVGEIGLSYEIVDEAHRAYLDFKITNTLDYYKVYEAFDGHAAGSKIEISDYLALDPSDKPKCAASRITLTFNPTLFRLDMTSEAYSNMVRSTTSTLSDGYDYLNSITFNMDAISSASIRFFKLQTTNNYTYPYVTNTPAITFSTE